MTEQKIQFLITNYLKKEGWWITKLMMTTTSGIPDLLCIKGGKTIFIEVKKPGGRLSKIQEYRIAEIRKENIPVLITDNLQEVKEWVDTMKADTES